MSYLFIYLFQTHEIINHITLAVLSTAPPKPVQRQCYFKNTGTRIGSDQTKKPMNEDRQHTYSAIKSLL